MRVSLSVWCQGRVGTVTRGWAGWVSSLARLGGAYRMPTHLAAFAPAPLHHTFILHHLTMSHHIASHDILLAAPHADAGGEDQQGRPEHTR